MLNLPQAIDSITFASFPRTVLVVDDDPAITELLTVLLEIQGYAVRVAATGKETLASAQRSMPDLVLLDLDLRDSHGLVLCSQLRERSEVPIMLMSRTAERWQAVAGLRLGADDFVAKPFDIAELLARIAGLMRRYYQFARPAAPNPAPNTVEMSSLAVHRIQHRATIDGTSVCLSPIEHGLLLTLVANAEQVVTFHELGLMVWGDTLKSRVRTINTHVTRLRAKLAAAGGPTPQILCERQVGYRITDPPLTKPREFPRELVSRSA